MSSSARRPRLHVEGPDDQHVIVHLLKRHGVDYDAKPWPSNWPEVVPSNGVDAILETMSEAIALSSQQPIGFVLDADGLSDGKGLLSRWSSVASKLGQLGVMPPQEFPSAGLIIDVPKFKTTVGVWIMPDNQRDGAIEQFLKDLIDKQDRLIGLAQSSTSDAKSSHGATFSDGDSDKATLHAWLAWQTKPGKPYGQAIAAKYFRHDSAAALAFLAWFRRLYRLDGVAMADS